MLEETQSPSLEDKNEQPPMGSQSDFDQVYNTDLLQNDIEENVWRKQGSDPRKRWYHSIVSAELSWCFYDVANSIYFTQVLAVFLPIYFRNVAAINLQPSTASTIWAIATSVSLILVALTSPLLGAISDVLSIRKYLFFISVLFGCLFCCLFSVISYGMYILCLIIFIASRIAFGYADMFYNALLVFVVRPDQFDTEKEYSDEMDRVSSKGYIMGYFAGAIFLTVTMIVYFLLNQNVLVIQFQYIAVGIHTFIFTLPLMFLVRESKSNVEESGESSTVVKKSLSQRWKEWKSNPAQHVKTSFTNLGKALVVAVNSVKMSIIRLVSTVKEIKQFIHLFLFLIGYYFFNDALATVQNLAVTFASEIRDEITGEQVIDSSLLIMSILVVQFLSVPFTYFWVSFAKLITAKVSILIGLVIQVFVTVWGYFLGRYSVGNLGVANTAIIQFFAMCVLISFTMGSTQALARSIFSTMVPKSKSGELFGFFSLSGKFAGILGPLMFALFTFLSNDSRLGIISVGSFFLLGIIFLLPVNVKQGRLNAKRYEEELMMKRSVVEFPSEEELKQIPSEDWGLEATEQTKE